MDEQTKIYLLPNVPLNTLAQCASVIKSQNIFNVYTATQNKTQTGITAEWSQRSTIAYTMTVAVSHFLAGVPSPYHPKCRDIDFRLCWQMLVPLMIELQLVPPQAQGLLYQALLDCSFVVLDLFAECLLGDGQQFYSLF